MNAIETITTYMAARRTAESSLQMRVWAPNPAVSPGAPAWFVCVEDHRRPHGIGYGATFEIAAANCVKELQS